MSIFSNKEELADQTKTPELKELPGTRYSYHKMHPKYIGYREIYYIWPGAGYLGGPDSYIPAKLKNIYHITKIYSRVERCSQFAYKVKIAITIVDICSRKVISFISKKMYGNYKRTEALLLKYIEYFNEHIATELQRAKDGGGVAYIPFKYKNIFSKEIIFIDKLKIPEYCIYY